MRLLIDTHVAFWSTMARAQLSEPARQALEDEANNIWVSVGSAWEIAIKVGLNKWPEATQLIADFERYMDDAGFEILPITVAHVRSAGTHQSQHRDPFDRLLAAQAQIEGLTLVTADAKGAGARDELALVVGAGKPTLLEAGGSRLCLIIIPPPL